MHNFTFSESGLAILHFLFLREVINKLALSVGEGGKNRDCIAAQIYSLQPQSTILTQSSKVSKTMKSTIRKNVHPPNFQMENVMFHFKGY